MDIFKLYESTMADLQPGQNIKHLRRDQLLDNYEASAKTLMTLIRAKESEIAHRKDLIKMLEESKVTYDSKLARAKQDYQTAKNNVPPSVDIKSISRLDPQQSAQRTPLPPPPTPPLPQSSQEVNENRSSLDRRLSEFMKTFPNISQTGLVPPTNIDVTKPPPGYYTQQTLQQQMLHQPLLAPPPPPPMLQAATSSTHSHQSHHSRK